MPSPVWRRRSLILPYAAPSPSPSPASDLLSAAIANNATHLWRANDYSTTTGWSDAIAGINLAITGTVAKTTSSDVTIVTFIPSSSVTGAIVNAEPFEILMLASASSTAGNTIFTRFSTTNTNYRIRISSGSWQISASTQVTVSVANTLWNVVYTKFTGVNPSLFKAGDSALTNANAGSASASLNALTLGLGNVSFNAVAMNTLGNWTTANRNAIASQMVAEASGLSPIWTAIP